MTDVSEIRPRPGAAQRLAAGLRVVLAPNPSPMTLHGTNSYILGEGRVAVIDPGPADPRHLAALLGALSPGETVSHIFVTHAHLDHSPLARPLAGATGAPILAFGDARAGRSAEMDRIAAQGGLEGGEGVDAGFVPDEALAHGDEVAGEGWTVRALHTPGHFGNHLSFQSEDAVFCGDHVMGWSSSLVSPPDGDMGAYMASLDLLAGLGARLLYSGHGDPIADPAGRIPELVDHRRARESAICAALADGPANADDLARRIYTDTPEALLRAASRNVLAHLLDLTKRNLAKPEGELNALARFHAM